MLTITIVVIKMKFKTNKINRNCIFGKQFKEGLDENWNHKT